jgi:hypothetical protein
MTMEPSSDPLGAASSGPHRFTLPPDYDCIGLVDSFEELLETPFSGDVNALCWPRELPGDFHEIVRMLDTGTGINSISDATLNALPLSAAGRVARVIIAADRQRLRRHHLSPNLDCIHGYDHSDEGVVIPTHVQSWHVDSATDEADTWLCTYSGAPSEGIQNFEAMRRVDDPATRAQLLQMYGGKDDDGFLDFLNEHFFDLHYQPLPGARPWSFGVGHLWRIACLYDGSPVPPCVHRAPPTIPGQHPRLLLIS